MTAETTSVSDGVTATFAVPFPYFQEEDVYVLVNGEGYLGSVSWVSPGIISLNPVPPAGAKVTRKRVTSGAVAKSVFGGGALASGDLNRNQTQDLYLIEELQDTLSRGLLFNPGDPVYSVDQLFAMFTKGDPGGNVMSIGLFTSLPTLNIPAGVELIQSSGYSVRGRGKARYVLDADQATVTSTTTRKKSLNGLWFKLAEDIVNFEMVGAVGDGVANDYQAIRDVCALGKSVFAPNGRTYYIAGYKGDGAGTTNIVWTTPGITLDGNGSKIVCNGNFNRTLTAQDLSPDRHFPYGDKNSVTPFWLSADNITWKNWEVYGQVDLMTQATGSGEGDAFGVLVSGNGIVLENSYIHHMACDGIYMGLPSPDGLTGTRHVPRNFRISNVRSRFNARQGLSIGAGRQGIVEGCDFSYTGFASVASDGTGVVGSYGYHAPAAGVDVEMEMTSPDFPLSDVTFLRCTIEENHGKTGDPLRCQVALSPVTAAIKHIVFDSCTFRMRATPGALFLTATQYHLVNNLFENVACLLDYGAVAGEDESLQAAKIANNVFDQTIAMGMLGGGNDAAYPTSPYVNITDNEFTFAAPTTGGIVIDKWPDVTFRNNRIRIQASVFVDAGGGKCAFGNFGGRNVGNSFEAAALSGANRFVVTYETSTYPRSPSDSYTGPIGYALDTGGDSGGVTTRFGESSGLTATLPSLVAGASASMTNATVRGARLGMGATVIPLANAGGRQFKACVVADDTVSWAVDNPTASTIGSTAAFSVILRLVP